MTDLKFRQRDFDFSRDLAPVLAKNCVACHNVKKPEGGLNLESHEALLVGGDSGAAVVAGNAAESSLVERVISGDDPMPPDDNSVGAQRLTANEVELLRQAGHGIDDAQDDIRVAAQ